MGDESQWRVPPSWLALASLLSLLELFYSLLLPPLEDRPHPQGSPTPTTQ